MVVPGAQSTRGEGLLLEGDEAGIWEGGWEKEGNKKENEQAESRCRERERDTAALSEVEKKKKEKVKNSPEPSRPPAHVVDHDLRVRDGAELPEVLAELGCKRFVRVLIR